jgi:histidine triad (HIT) family protein
MESCIFCKIASGEIPSYKVYDDDGVMGFLDIQPANPGHALVIPKEHYANFIETPDDILAKVFTAAKAVGRAACEAVDAPALNIIVNNGAVAGQVVSHLHVHAIPRFEDDGHRHWAKKSVSEEKMKDIAEKTRTILGK